MAKKTAKKAAPRTRRPAAPPLEPRRADTPTSWRALYAWHHDRAARIDHHLERRGGHELGVLAARGIIGALLALASIHKGVYVETRRIRRLMEEQAQNAVALNLSGRNVPKHGGCNMAGPFNPAETEDVDFAISPVNAAGQPIAGGPGTFTWSASGPGGSLVVADDCLSAKLVTQPGSFDLMVVVTQPRTGLSDSANVSRTGAPPPDENAVSLGLTGQVVAKA